MVTAAAVGWCNYRLFFGGFFVLFPNVCVCVCVKLLEIKLNFLII